MAYENVSHLFTRIPWPASDLKQEVNRISSKGIYRGVYQYLVKATGCPHRYTYNAQFHTNRDAQTTVPTRRR